MAIDNYLYCSNCSEKNPLYLKNCTNCKHYLRAAVPNIDFWKTTWQLFESPKNALTNIIYADHKNLIIILLIALSVKFFLTSATVQSLSNLIIPYSEYFWYNTGLLVAIYTATVLIFAKIFGVIANKNGRTRYKDNLSIFIYSFIPAILGLFIITPVAYGIFGKHWFISNPSPFLIKETFAYIIVAVEVIMFLWSFFILAIGFSIQSNSKVITAVMLVVFLLILISEIIFIPFIIL